jgi:hypothetical protein
LTLKVQQERKLRSFEYQDTNDNLALKS